MENTGVYDTIRNAVQTCLPGSRVVLFGSHGRGQSDRHSDYDLLVVTPPTFTPREKANWSTRLDRAIVAAIHAPVDVLLYSEQEIQENRSCLGILFDQ